MSAGVRGRGTFVVVLRRCLRIAAPATAATALAGWLLHTLTTPTLAVEAAPAAASPWLLLPLAVAALSCAIVATATWPSFARHRPGQEWVLRLARTRFAGAGAAVLAALGAQLVLTLPLCALLPRGLGAPAEARPHWQLPTPAVPVLDGERPLLRCEAPAGTVARELRLRPIAVLPRGALQPTSVVAFADGAALPGGTVEFAETGQLWSIPFPPRAVATLELRWQQGSIPLLFPPGSIVLVGEATHGTLGNGCLLALVALLPTWLALALGCCAGAASALPTTLAVVASVLFVQLIAGLGPLAEALLLLLRGHWLPASQVFPQCLPSLAVGSLAMIAAMLLRPRGPR